MDSNAQQATVLWVAKIQTRLRDLTLTFSGSHYQGNGHIVPIAYALLQRENYFSIILGYLNLSVSLIILLFPFYINR